MLQYFKLTSLSVWVLFIFTGFATAENYRTVLIGGGLNVCTTVHKDNCKTPLSLNETLHSEHRYLVNDKNINTLTRLYTSDNSIQTKNMDTFISGINKLKKMSKSYSEKGLSRLFRTSGLSDANKLDPIHWQMILDVFQEQVISKRFLQRDRYKNVKVDVLNSKELFVGKALREFIDNVDGDEILIVTAAQRDAFEDVYWLIKAFEEYDVDVNWLPLDLAVASIWKNTDISDSDKVELACKNISETRHRVSKRYFRDRIYGDLSEQLLESCNDPQELLELIDDADGIFIHDGEPEVLRDSFMLSDIEPNHVWKRILERHQSGKVTLAFNGGSIRAIGGNEGRNAFVVKGSSKDVLSEGYGILSNFGPDKSHQNSLKPVMSLSGLGLIDGISFDNEFNNKSHHGRLLGLLAMVKLPYGIGIDERTVLSIKQNGANAMDLKVTGEGGVTIINNTKLERKALVPAKLNHVMLNYMTQDDTAIFKDNRFTFDFANWKYSSNRFSQPVVQAGKVFRPEGFSKTLYMLCTTGAKKAVLKHIELGKGHVFNLSKLSSSASVSGTRNVSGNNYSYCSYRDYEVSVTPY